MTGIITSLDGKTPLSRLTIASLHDLGYEADLNRADPYALPAAGSTALSLAEGHGLEEIILYPQPLPPGMVIPVD